MCVKIYLHIKFSAGGFKLELLDDVDNVIQSLTPGMDEFSHKQ